MKRDHLLGFFQVNEFTAPTPAEKKRIHLARVSRTLAKEDKLRRAYSGGNVISAREKDKLETAKLSPAKPAPTVKTATKPSFNPMTEPLQVGDLVEVVYAGQHCGKTGRVLKIGPWVVVEGTANGNGSGWASRSSLRLIEKASHA